MSDLKQSDQIYQRMIDVDGFDAFPIYSDGDRASRQGVGVLVSTLDSLISHEKILFVSGEVRKRMNDDRWSKFDGTLRVFTDAGIYEADVSNYPEHEGAVTASFAPYKSLSKVELTNGNVWWFTERDDSRICAAFVTSNGTKFKATVRPYSPLNTADELLSLVAHVKALIS